MTQSLETTFLTEDQIWGDSALDVIKAYNTKVAPTDLAVLLGTLMGGGNCRTSEGDITVFSWSVSSTGFENVRSVNYEGNKLSNYTYTRSIAARPVLPLSVTSTIIPNNVRELEFPDGQSVQICEFGEYPQTIANNKTAQHLENLHSKNALSVTGKKYTFDTEELDAYDKDFKPQEYPEYELEGRRIYPCDRKAC